MAETANATSRRKAKAGKKLVSVVVSFRNEAETLPELIRRLEAVFSARPEDYEIIFVNDDSTDDSLGVLTGACARNNRIRVINMSRRFGHAECLKAGLAHAAGDAVVSIDADLQDPPEVIPEMLDEWLKGAEVVYTVRTKREGEPAFRMAMTWIAYRIIQLFSPLQLPVDSGDFRLMSRRATAEFLRLNETQPYVRGLAIWIGFKRAPVQYVRQARAAGEGHFPGTFSMGALQSFVAGITSFSMVPLFFLLVLGLVATAASLAGLIAVALGLPLPAGSAMVLFLVFLWGSLMAAIGVVAVYVSRIYADVRGRPGYIVKDTIGFPKKG